MTTFIQLPTLPHLESIFEGIAATNPHDGATRALSIDPRRSLVLRAPAGSGKTTQLLFRVLACLTVVQRPEEILAITFTNKAAGEIVGRVMASLSLAAKGVEPSEPHEIPLYRLSRSVLERDALLGWNLLLNPSRIRIMTFDSFCAYLAAKTPIMSGLGGGRTADDPSLIYRQAILETLGSVNDEDISDDLREALESVLTFAKNRFELLVPMFGALLAKRDQWVGDVLTLNIGEMALAMSEMVRDAAAEAIGVVKASGLAAAADILKEASGALDGFEWAAVPELDSSESGQAFMRAFATYMLTTDGKLRARVNATNGMPAGNPVTVAMNKLLADFKGESNGVVKALVLLQGLPDADYPERSAVMAKHLTVILRSLMVNLMVAFDASATVDFAEVAQRAIQSLGSGMDIGDALLDEDRISHIMVDEFQDTSPAQFNLLLKLVEHWDGDDSRSAFFCGDVAQSIYLFRGATVDLFTSMVKDLRFGPKELEVHNLVVNFRSAPNVVEWNNYAYSKVFAGSNSTYVPSVPFRTFEGSVSVEPITSGALGEAARVVEIVKSEIANDPEQSIAILVRGRSHLKHILPALKKAGISASGTDIDPIFESVPVSEVISLIRALWHNADRTSWLSLLRASFVGLSWKDCLTVSQGNKVIPEALRNEDVIERLTEDGKVRVKRLVAVLDGILVASRGDELAWAAKSCWVALGGVSTVDDTEMADVTTVFKLLVQYTATGSLVDPQAFFNALGKLYASPKAGQVQVMTIHKSKGLEFDTVILPSLQKNGGSDDAPLFYWRRVNGAFALAPNIGDRDALSPESRLFNFIGDMVKADIREEMSRVAYVGTTRAKRNAYLLACMNVKDEGTTLKPPASSLLSCLWPAVSDAFEAAEQTNEIDAEIVSGVPAKARLTPNFVVELPADCFIPAATNDALPSENELEDELRETEGNDYRSKIRGIVYHRVVELIGKEGGGAWTIARVDGKTQAIASLLRREGYPIREIGAAVRLIRDLVATTLASEKGQWILAKHAEGGQEVRVSGYSNGRWKHRILDRPFIDDGFYWIIDWKTAACPEGMDVEAFCSGQAAKYAPKMNEYKRAVQDAGVSLPVRLGLYLPAVDRFVEVV